MGNLKRILVVDDEERDRSLLEAMLDSLGYKAELACDGAEALEKLNSNIDLVLLDVLMPGLDCLEITRRIRNRQDCENQPILIVTGGRVKQDFLDLVAAGASDFISKPINIVELQVRVASLLKMKDALEALRYGEEKYQILVETAQDVIWTVDLDLRFTYVSPSITRALGYTVEEMMSMHPLSGFTPASRDSTIKAFKEELAIEAETPRDRNAFRTQEIERYHKDGSIRWAEITMNFLRDSKGNPIGIMGVSHDITERKQMEDALRKARDELEHRVEERTAELLRANEQLTQEITDRKRAEEALHFTQFVVDHMSDSVFWARPDGSLAYVNDAACARLGYARAELLALRVIDLVPNYTEDRWAAHWQALKQNGSMTFESRHQEKTSEVFPVEILTDYVHFKGEEYACGRARDITDRNRAEEALRESEERYRALFEGAAEGILVADVETQKLSYANPAICKMLGYTTEEMVQLNVSDIHPAESIQQAIAEFEALGREDKLLVLNLPCVRKDGSVFYADIMGRPVVIEKRRMNVGFFTDVTERKRAEEASRDSEERFRAFSEATFEAIFLTHKGVGIDQNLAAEKMFGYSTEEILGQLGTEAISPEYRDLVLNNILSGYEEPYEAVALRKDGTTFPCEIQGKVFNYQGRPVRVTAIRDISTRKAAEEALRESEDRYRQITENSLTGIYINQEGVCVYVNQRMADILGYAKEEMIGRQFLGAVHPADREMVLERARARLNGELSPAVYELRLVNTTGEEIWCEVLATLTEYQGRPALMGNVADITDRKRGEYLLRESESRYRALFENSPDGILIAGVETKRFTHANPSVCRMLDYTLEELRALGVADIHPHDQLPQVMAEFEAQARGEKVVAPNIPCLRKDGTVFYADISTTAAVLDGRTCNVGFFRDITERKRAEEALRESEGKYRFLAEHASDVLWTMDLNMRTTYVSPSIEKVLGFAPEERMQQNLGDQLTAESFDIARQRLFEELRRESEQGILPDRSAVLELDFLHKNGSIVCLESVIRFIRDETGAPIGCHGLSRDITERKKAEEAVQKKISELNSFINNIPDMAWLKDVDSNFIAANKAFGDAVGMAPEYLANHTCEICFGTEAARKFKQDDERVMASRERIIIEESIVDANKNTIWLETIKSPTVDASEKVIGTVGIARNISDRKRAEQERETLREQLFQAQKMETVGTLAGGIAHDFNNLLTIMNGFAEMLLTDTAEDDPRYGDLQKILETGRRGADLVQRLLVFSKKAEISLQPLNLNHIVKNLVDLMERTLPKMIEIETILSKELGMVNADAVQVEQVLMNLCINAKEGMPEGGQLRIETRNMSVEDDYCRLHPGAKPGRHVLIAISDTGTGMSKETMERMFDPFFTTKGWDFKKGTGLGLSVAKGIVEQHGGWIACQSELSEGTTFKIYLPVLEGIPEYTKPEAETAAVPGVKKILLVDDEEYVRDLGRRILERSGYNVLTASNGREALKIYARERSNIGLIVLDLIMPHMGGEKCLEELLKINPQARVVISTGHSLDPKERDHLGAHAKGFVNKPYQMKQFMEVVREALGRE